MSFDSCMCSKFGAAFLILFYIYIYNAGAFVVLLISVWYVNYTLYGEGK